MPNDEKVDSVSAQPGSLPQTGAQSTTSVPPLVQEPSNSLSEYKTLGEDLVERAGWTFVEAAVPVLVASGGKLSLTVLVAAGAAGLSALKTWLKSLRENVN